MASLWPIIFLGGTADALGQAHNRQESCPMGIAPEQSIFNATQAYWRQLHFIIIQWAQKALQCLAVLDYLQCGALWCGNLT